MRYIHWVPTLFVAITFVQSLFFKFTRSPETVYIFEDKLESWATSLGFPGLFVPGGLFSAPVVGAGELVASVLLVVGAASPALRGLQFAGAALGLGVIGGAVFFHLFTPLGIAVRNADGTSDGGQLFGLAVAILLGCAWILWLRRDVALQWLARLPVAS